MVKEAVPDIFPLESTGYMETNPPVHDELLFPELTVIQRSPVESKAIPSTTPVTVTVWPVVDGAPLERELAEYSTMVEVVLDGLGLPGEQFTYEVGASVTHRFPFLSKAIPVKVVFEGGVIPKVFERVPVLVVPVTGVSADTKELTENPAIDDPLEVVCFKAMIAPGDPPPEDPPPPQPVMEKPINKPVKVKMKFFDSHIGCAPFQRSLTPMSKKYFPLRIRS